MHSGHPKAQVNLGEYATWFLVAIFIIMLVIMYVLFTRSV